MSADGTRWVRHGLFRSYYRNGTLASEGNYVDGAEDGLWTEYHENGRMAARGHYKNGEEVGQWEFWDDNGVPTTD
jgi:antitoxin component YwqK of YwqJK toxin-antitoxin module